MHSTIIFWHQKKKENSPLRRRRSSVNWDVDDYWCVSWTLIDFHLSLAPLHYYRVSFCCSDSGCSLTFSNPLKVKINWSSIVLCWETSDELWQECRRQLQKWQRNCNRKLCLWQCRDLAVKEQQQQWGGKSVNSEQIKFNDFRKNEAARLESTCNAHVMPLLDIALLACEFMSYSNIWLVLMLLRGISLSLSHSLRRG